ncbi:class I SAM-dependent methyltransferase [Streptomyces sp. NPDC091279]|uniref:class I SAM-dependent methyltransferase n=1 Tax=unclassified Streptomyces TaxID=2593676 RepID=UPI003809D270
MTFTSADLWHHYGRTRAESDREVPGVFRWGWGQDGGPGPEVLGDLAGRVVGDLGAGGARHAAHLAVHHDAAQVVAVDASPAQYEMATGMFGHLAPRLSIVRSDVVSYLRSAAGGYDVLYSVFGAVDFTDPRELLRAAALALKPGGRLVFSTLAHCVDGAPGQPDVVAVDVRAKTPEGEAATMRRWVLQEQVWAKILDEAGFTGVNVELLPSTVAGPHAVDTLLVSAVRPWASPVARPPETRTFTRRHSNCA